MTFLPPQSNPCFAPGMHSSPALKGWGFLQRSLKEIFAKNNLKGRKVLRYGSTAQQLQSMFLGLKPVAADIKIDDVKKITLPPRFKYVGDKIYDEEQVQATIAKNPDTFSDFAQYDGDINRYLQHIYSQERYQRNQIDKQIGLLYGYPKDAIDAHADYNDSYIKTVQYAHRMSQPDFITKFSPEERQVILHYAFLDDKGRPVSDPRTHLDKFLEEHKSEAYVFLEKHLYELTPEQRHYIVESKGAKTHGFTYRIGKPTANTEAFPKKLDKLYEESGMNTFLKSSKLLLTSPK